MTTAPTVLDLEATAKHDGERLTLDLLVANRHAHEVYFLHRFWKMARVAPSVPAGGVDLGKATGQLPSSGPLRMVWDERGPYRFEQGGILRVVFGPAPVPKFGSVSNRQIPFASRIEPGKSARFEVSIDVPVTEFALFDPPPPDVEYEEIEVKRIAVVAFGVAPGERVTVKPCPIDEAYFQVDAPDKRMVPTFGDVPCEPLPVRRRKDPITRYLLPGEPG